MKMLAADPVTMYKLRDYQVKAVNDGIEYFKTGSKGGLMILPTGAGAIQKCRLIFNLKLPFGFGIYCFITAIYLQRANLHLRVKDSPPTVSRCGGLFGGEILFILC